LHLAFLTSLAVTPSVTRSRVRNAENHNLKSYSEYRLWNRWSQ